MNAGQLIRRLEGLSDQLYREMIRLEKLEDRVGDYIDACDGINVPDSPDYRERITARDTARKGLDRLKWILAGLNEPLQEAVAVIGDTQETLDVLA